MRITLWGTRGSLAAPGADTARYGGNTACVEVTAGDGTVLVLDAGTGIRPLGQALVRRPRRVDVLLSHLHMDHIQGLGFFAPLYDPEVEVHVWGPASTTLGLRARLMRYLSPPLFPVHLRDLPNLWLHEVPVGPFDIGGFQLRGERVCHPGPTLGFRIASSGGTLCYMPDHEPALGVKQFPQQASWTSGYDLAAGVDLLIHDAQYTQDEYRDRVGWGHATLAQGIQLARLCGVKRFVPFHHDPDHSDDMLDRLIRDTAMALRPPFTVSPGTEGAIFVLGQG